MTSLELRVRTLSELACHCHFQKAGSHQVDDLITCSGHQGQALVTASSVVLPNGLITS